MLEKKKKVPVFFVFARKKTPRSSNK